MRIQSLFAMLAGVVFLATCSTAPSDGSDITDPTTILSLAKTGATCGGTDWITCGSKNDYCAFPVKACRKVATPVGKCTTKPEVCTMDYNPVCGCDGRTYSNACQASSNGANIAFKGECFG